MEPKKCPFCGAELGTHEIMYNDLMDKWVLTHFCDDRDCQNFSIFIVANTKQEVIENWNNRK